MSRDWSSLRRLASMAGAGLLLLLLGVVVTRGPSRREAQSPVYMSRASGLAGQGGAASEVRSGDVGISGPFTMVAQPASFDWDIRHLPSVPPVIEEARPELEFRASDKSPRAAIVDSAVQAAAGPSRPSQAMPGLLKNFPGLSFNNGGSGWPPDTNGDVGPNHYVQVVNTSVGIYSKTGELAAPPFTFNALFAGSGTVCDGNNRGDPVALYDAQADRWIVTDFSWINIDNGPHYQCIAASQTGDPTGSWWLYALRADDDAHKWLNDYPKLGVWPDGIYMSANMFACSNNCSGNTPFEGTRVWAISPTQLYAGTPLTTVVFDTGSSYFSLLPSNFRGAAPPAGTPNYFVSNDDVNMTLDAFKFHVDWTHPLSSTFTGPTTITEAGYTVAPSTVPQPGSVGLDSLGDRLMMQNQYRNLSGDESLWIAHTVDDPTGIRWYQVSVTSGTVVTTPVQQGTYAPSDGLYRWMPSLAVDRFGDMAVGYSTSSASQFPAIRYAGRLVTDTVNTLGQSEALLIAGGGSQTTACGNGTCNNRWGDYSAMTVDPSDDCTFWYTSEYYAVSGSNWQTRIGSFRFPICGPVPPPLTPQMYLPLVSFNTNKSVGSWTPIMQEGFEGAWPSPGWQVTDPGIEDYFWGKSSCRASSGGSSAWAMGAGNVGSGLGCGASYVNYSNSWMVYGPFSLADATTAELQAMLWLNTETNYDAACLMASVDGNHFYTSNAGTCFSGSSSGNFVPTTLDLNDVYTLGNLVGQTNVWIAVIFQSDFSITYPEGAYVDDLLLHKCGFGACTTLAANPQNGQLHPHTAMLLRPAKGASAPARP